MEHVVNQENSVKQLLIDAVKNLMSLTAQMEAVLLPKSFALRRLHVQMAKLKAGQMNVRILWKTLRK